MVQINSEFSVKGHRRQLFLGALLLVLSLLCVAMTVMFLFVNNSANRRVEDIREQYRVISERREAQVSELTNQLITMQKKLDGLPDRTANKTVEKVQQSEGESAPPKATH